jgi:hypothetical protein
LPHLIDAIVLGACLPFLLGIAPAAPAARAVARATVVVPADVSSVSIESVCDGDYVHVTIAFD